MPSVLIIEDDPDMRALERLALECGGYDVTTATNGAEGLRSLQRQRPCVILLDLMMPVMDGITFLRERQKGSAAVDVPVICVSAAGPELLDQALRLGAAACVHKPADFDDLCELVGRYCRSARSRDDSDPGCC